MAEKLRRIGKVLAKIPRFSREAVSHVSGKVSILLLIVDYLSLETCSIEPLELLFEGTVDAPMALPIDATPRRLWLGGCAAPSLPVRGLRHAALASTSLPGLGSSA